MEKTLSVIVPIYSEEELISEFYRRTEKVLASIGNEINYEIIYVNDGSKDNSLIKLKELREKDKNIRIIDLSRNFGHQLAITCGLDFAKGDAVVLIDGDLQDPPEVIIEMYKKWKEGYKIVYGKRTLRKGEGLFKKITAKIYYRFINMLSDYEIPQDVGDFRLLDHEVVEVLRNIREESRYLRGLVSWVGFSSCAVYYERDTRFAGETKYTLRKMLKLAIDGATGFSEKPLSIALYFGMICTIFSFLSIIWIIANKLAFPDYIISGWTSQIITTLFLGGVQLLTIGIIGQYIGRIYREVKSRPLYIVNKKIGFDKDNG